MGDQPYCNRDVAARVGWIFVKARSPKTGCGWRSGLWLVRRRGGGAGRLGAGRVGQAAEQRLKAATGQIRNERLAPLARQDRSIWGMLRARLDRTARLGREHQSRAAIASPASVARS
jgi:hypothetical protein